MESVVEIYAASVCMYYACCATILVCCKKVQSYTRSKDLKNACTHLSEETKKSGLRWGVVWPAWILYSIVKKRQ